MAEEDISQKTALTPQEQRLVECAAKGEWWAPEAIGHEIQLDFDPAYAFGWNDNRTIRGEIIRCLLAGEIWPGESKPWSIGPKGLMIVGARIAGPIDLEGAILTRTLRMHACSFDAAILLRDVQARTISFAGSYLAKGLNAEISRFSGNVVLSGGFTTKGEVRLVGAKIEGQLACNGGYFENADGKALNANAISVGADVFLNDGFTAKGEVNLRRAKIEGQLACSGGHFENEDKTALDGNAMNVGADVFLRDGFTAKGEVHLAGAKIEGQLDCNGGHFENEGKTALNGNAISVGADVFLSERFTARGEVNLGGAKIEGQLACVGGHFENKGKTALNGDAISVGADVFLRSGFTARGEVNLTGAKIEGGLLCISATFCNPDGAAIDLTLAEIGAALIFRNLKQSPEGRPGIDGRLILRQAKCRTYSDDTSAWPRAGELVLDGFTYDRFDDCETSCASRQTWLELQNTDHLTHSFRPHPWTQAVKILREMGHDDDARDLAIQREIARWKCERKWLRRLWLKALLITIGGGYKPSRVIYWSLAFFAVGWFFFALAGNLGYMAPRQAGVVAYLASHPHAPVPPRYTEFNSFIYAWDAYLPVLEFGQTDAWEPTNVRRADAPPLPPDRTGLGCAAHVAAWLFAHGFHRLIGWIEEFFGWIFVSLFVVGMTGLVKRE